MTKDEVLQAVYQYARQERDGEFVEKLVRVALAGAMGMAMPTFHGREPVMPPKYDDIDDDLADIVLEPACVLGDTDCEACQ